MCVCVCLLRARMCACGRACGCAGVFTYSNDQNTVLSESTISWRLNKIFNTVLRILRIEFELFYLFNLGFVIHAYDLRRRRRRRRMMCEY